MTPDILIPENKVILITGAAQGLGRRIAEASAKNNNHLILLDKDLKTLEDFYDELSEKPCQPALYPMDLEGATPDDYQQLFVSLQNEYGHLDQIFLNAASLPGFTPIEHYEIPQWYSVVQVNLHANFHILQALLPMLYLSKHGQIIGILDEELNRCPAYYGAYGVAKAGFEQLLKSLAAESHQKAIDIYTAKLAAFQSNTRSKHFPSENPNTLPHSQEVAAELVDLVEKGQQAELIVKLDPNKCQKQQN